MKATHASAPAKLILFGEHSVVYGRHALACSLGLRTTATCHCETTGTQVSLQMPLMRAPRVWPTFAACEADRTRLAAALGSGTLSDADKPILAFLTMLRCLVTAALPPHGTGADIGGIAVTVASDVPAGAGLGSSASLSVAIAGALAAAIGRPGVDTQAAAISALALDAERVFHAHPSGVDSTVCALGGALLFAKATGPRQLARLRAPAWRVLVVDTGVPRSTRDAVLAVRSRLSSMPPAEKDALMDRMDAIALRAAAILEQAIAAPAADDGGGDGGGDDLTELEGLIDENQAILRDRLGVSHPAIDRVVAIAQEHGLHAKLTGAGCGGCVFVLVPRRCAVQADAALASLQASGFVAFSATLCVEGLSLTPAPPLQLPV